MNLVGKRVIFNPIFYGEVYQGNGIELIKQRNPQVEDNGVILGTVVEDRHTDALIAGPVELNGWHFVYLISKSSISSILDDDLMNPFDGSAINP